MTDDSQSLFEQAVKASQQKDFATTRLLLKQLLKQEPNHLNAWLLAAHVVESPSDAILCCKRVLQLDPENVHAKQKLARLQSEQPVSSQVTPPANPPTNVYPASPPVEQRSIERYAPVSQLPAVRPDVSIQQPVTILPSTDQTPNSKAPQTSLQTGLITLAGILFVVLCLAIVGIGAYMRSGQAFGTAVPTPTDKILFNVLYQNAQAATSENTKAYMNTIHPSSPMYGSTEVGLEFIFSEFDLTFQYYNLKVISINSNEAELHFSLVTRKVSGPAFRDNIVTGTVTLRPDKGVWKIYNQKVEETKFEN